MNTYKQTDEETNTPQDIPVKVIFVNRNLSYSADRIFRISLYLSQNFITASVPTGHTHTNSVYVQIFTMHSF